MNERDQRAKNTKMVIVSVSRYIGNEILDNIIEIEDIVTNSEKSEEQLKTQANISEAALKMAQVGIWSAAAEELVVSLEDKQHQGIVQSGLIAKVENNNVADGIRLSYQKMDNLIKRLRRFSKFCNMLLSPPENMPKELFDYQLNENFTGGIKAVELDIKIFKNEASRTIKEINKLLKPYGNELKIEEYREDKELPQTKDKID